MNYAKKRFFSSVLFSCAALSVLPVAWAFMAHGLAIISSGDVDLYLNGFKYDNKPKTYEMDVTTRLVSGENTVVIYAGSIATILIRKTTSDSFEKEVFSAEVTRDEVGTSVEKKFELKDFSFSWSWETADSLENLKSEDIDQIKRIVAGRVNAFKENKMQEMYVDFARYHVDDLAHANGRTTEQEVRALMFFYDRFLSPLVRQDWLDCNGGLVIEISPYNDRIVNVSRAAGDPIFKLKTSAGDYYEESYMYFMRKDGQWYLL